MNSCEQVTAISTLAASIACVLTNDELSMLVSILIQLADTLDTIALHRELCSPEENI